MVLNAAVGLLRQGCGAYFRLGVRVRSSEYHHVCVEGHVEGCLVSRNDFQRSDTKYSIYTVQDNVSQFAKYDDERFAKS